MNISWASLGSCPRRFWYFELYPLSTTNPVFYFLDSSQSPIMSCNLYQHNKIILLKRWAQSLAQVSMLVFPLFFWEHVPNCIYFIYMNCYLNSTNPWLRYPTGSSITDMHQLSLDSLTFNWLLSGNKADKPQRCHLVFPPGDVNTHIARLTKL